MSGFRIEGATSGNVAEVTADNQLQVTLPQTLTDAGLAVITGQNGDGTYTSGTPYRKTARVSQQDRLLVGIDTPEFDYNFTWTSQDTGVWKFLNTTLTGSQASGFCILNTGSVTTTSTSAAMQTWRYFDLVGNGTLRVAVTGQVSATIPTNVVIEAGLFVAVNAAAAPADGVFFRINNSAIMGVLSYNGTETTTTFSSTAYTTFMTAGNTVDLMFQCGVEGVEFYIEDQYLGIIETPAGNAMPFLSGGLPVSFSQRHTGAAGSAIQFKVGHVRVTQMSVDVNIPFAHQQTGQGALASQAQQGSTVGSTALYSNSLAPGAGVAMTNTTAALGTGLGGQFAALPTLAANTDGIVCSYQNPAGSTSVQGRTLMITGVRIQSIITTVLVGGPLYWFYSLAYGHTSVSMATTETTSFTSPSTKAPRRIPLGMETIAATAAVGTLGSAAGVYMPFNSPISVNPGEFVAICAKNIGTVTSSGVCTFLVTFDGYWI